MLCCKKKGIHLDKAIPYMPQLNRKTERLNRTLMEKARTLFDSEQDKKMQGKAIYTSAYLLNRTSTETLKTTPFEMWEKRKNLKSLFGSKAYAKVLTPLKKLNKRSEKHIRRIRAEWLQIVEFNQKKNNSKVKKQ